MGAITALGHSAGETWNHCLEGKCASAPITRFQADSWPSRWACEVTLSHERSSDLSLATEFAWRAAQEAVGQSEIAAYDRDWASRASLYVGAGNGSEGPQELVALLRDFSFAKDMKGLAHYLVQQKDLVTMMKKEDPSAAAFFLANFFSISRGVATLETACAAGAQAIAKSYRDVAQGHTTFSIAGGSDSLAGELLFAGFCLLGVLAPYSEKVPPQSACRPFDKFRTGFVPGEGAGMLFLEDWDHAIQRGATIYAEIKGVGESSNAYRVTDIPEDGRGAQLSMQSCLESGGVLSSEVDYINAHGTGTLQNDQVEYNIVRELFCDHGAAPRKNPLVMGSNKASFGHLVAAAGAVEAVMTVLSLHHQCVPPSLNLEHPLQNPDSELEFANPFKGTSRELRYAISNSFGFGGSNCSLLFAKKGATR